MSHTYSFHAWLGEDVDTTAFKVYTPNYDGDCYSILVGTMVGQFFNLNATLNLTEQQMITLNNLITEALTVSVETIDVPEDFKLEYELHG